MSAIEMPQLDLGELGDQIDAALRDEPEEDSANEPDVVSEDASVVEDEQPEADPKEAEPAAEAEVDDFEAQFQERFQEEYQERSRKDISALQSKLQKQINAARQESAQERFAREEAEQFISALIYSLGEYDPDEAQKLANGRKSVIAERNQHLQQRFQQQSAVETQREAFYAEHFPMLDPHNVVLRKAFERGDDDAEKAAIEVMVKQYRLEQAAKPKRQAKAAVAQPEAPKAAPERDEQGKFLAKRVADTKAREVARGKIPSGQQAGAVPTKVSNDPATRQKQVAQMIERMMGQ